MKYVQLAQELPVLMYSGGMLEAYEDCFHCQMRTASMQIIFTIELARGNTLVLQKQQPIVMDLRNVARSVL